MITPLMFWGFTAFALVLAGYTLIDNQNRVFGHIISGIGAIILFFILALSMFTGNVGESVPISVNETVVNNTTSFVYTTMTSTYSDTAVGYALVFGGVVMLIITILATLEVVSDIREGSFE